MINDSNSARLFPIKSESLIHPLAMIAFGFGVWTPEEQNAGIPFHDDGALCEIEMRGRSLARHLESRPSEGLSCDTRLIGNFQTIADNFHNSLFPPTFLEAELIQGRIIVLVSRAQSSGRQTIDGYTG